MARALPLCTVHRCWPALPTIRAGSYEALASLGLTVDTLQAKGMHLALSDLTLEYRAPLRAGDAFLVSVAASAVKTARVLVEYSVQQLPRPDAVDAGAPVLSCVGRATLVLLNASYRPMRVPADMRSCFEALCAERVACAAGDKAQGMQPAGRVAQAAT